MKWIFAKYDTDGNQLWSFAELQNVIEDLLRYPRTKHIQDISKRSQILYSNPFNLRKYFSNESNIFSLLQNQPHMYYMTSGPEQR